MNFPIWQAKQITERSHKLFYVMFYTIIKVKLLGTVDTATEKGPKSNKNIKHKQYMDIIS